MINGIYYKCTEYGYESGSLGKDQRVRFINGTYGVNPITWILLSPPQVGGGPWFMVTDKSAPSASSDVIWYTSSAGTKSMWI